MNKWKYDSNRHCYETTLNDNSTITILYNNFEIVHNINGELKQLGHGSSFDNSIEIAEEYIKTL